MIKFYALISLFFVNNSNGFDSKKLRYKDELRKNIIQNSLTHKPYASIDATNNPDLILEDGPAERNIVRLDQYQNASLPNLHYLWSDDYWSIKNGGLGHRFAMPEIQQKIGLLWTTNISLYQNPLFYLPSMIETKRSDQLSPSEKYDLLLGDQVSEQVWNTPFTGGLTISSWKEGKFYQETYNEVASWMGICHGWAAAAINIIRPKKQIAVKSPRGELIKFYPSEIKALISLLFAKGRYQTYFLGSRCEHKEPVTDEIGRISFKNCFDVNPGAWHIAIINQLGMRNKSMVIDSVYSMEVWNQPLINYNYRYVNLKTKERTNSLESALVNYDEFKSLDIYAKYRNKKPHSIIGIEMNVSYVLENSPVQHPTDDPRYDHQGSAFYQYDLELNESGEIVGGEWHSNNHPDFIWVPKSNTMADSDVDFYVSNLQAFDEDLKINPKVSEIGIRYASPKGQPLAKIVRALLELSLTQE